MAPHGMGSAEEESERPQALSLLDALVPLAALALLIAGAPARWRSSGSPLSMARFRGRWWCAAPSPR
jgi:hypothetical protein